ncbi:glycoside hydrolase family 92 protein [Phycicoccus endophyticus]|uniref:Glycoside hydrolase family 92 protein n=1 Tax=Phycicoccus endophyticus TaxID=1690220 RepID=A0A7G9R1J9_9MICO|nr:glycoside hydrolase domain-containing protein [Phycicoccus endophyticus]NHI18736.1 carbohydrate-binding protein [Phycicoccus endophyticus]QNN49474.1 glycoside hydrolase family 92 protein [Phycicoccus endophyticus]
MALLAAALCLVGFAPVAAAGSGHRPSGHGHPSQGGSARDYTALVDPFVGTQGDDGNDMPGAQAPNGLAKVNPRTYPDRNHTGYEYTEDHILGFTHTNLDGVGGSGGGGDILVVPTSGSYSARPSTGSYAHPFSHDDEEAQPGYYRVGLGNIAGEDGAISDADGTIDAEVTATTRSAAHRYSFPDGATPSLVLDLSTNNTQRVASSLTVTTLDDGRAAVSGRIVGHFYNASYTLYYYAETGQPVAGVQTWDDSDELTDATRRSGQDTGAVLTFDPADGEDVELHVTLSPISAEQARTDQRAELGEKSFDEIRAASHDEWNAKLGKVAVSASVATDPTGDLEKLFYTHLYRMFALPANTTSTSGTYRGVDGAVHSAQGFTYYDGWSTWDDFRKYSVFSYIDPEMYGDMVQSMVYLFADAEAAGGQSLGNLMHAAPTIRWERSALVLADALNKGYTGLQRLDEAYTGLERLVGGYSDADLARGYIAGRPGDAVQLGYDQWALAQVAEALGKDDEAAELRAQAALPIENLVKPDAWTAADGTEVGVLTPRDADGAWQTVDYEKFEAANLYQGTLWQYHWYDAYDMDALIDATGGEEATLLALRHMFGEDGPDDGSGMLHSNSNEIDLQTPYLFNYVGEPSLTQKWVRAIYTKETWNRYLGTGSTSEAPSGGGEFTPPVKTQVYSLSPDGLLPTMDNDAGTMSTMFVAAALGLFPVTSGSSQFQVGSPFFDSAVISYDSGRSFRIDARGVSTDDFYIRSATLDGKRFENTWVDYADIVDGGSLSFRMTDKPTRWGSHTEPAYSMSTATGTTAAPAVTAEPTVVEAAADGTVRGSVTLTLHGRATFRGPRGWDLTRWGAATVKGLPSGVKATVRVTGRRTASVRLTGTTSSEARFYVSFTDRAFTGRVSASDVDGQGVTSRSPLRLSMAASARATLEELVGQAADVRQGNYSLRSFTALQQALAAARELLADEDATSVQLSFGADALRTAIDGLAIDEGGFRILQGEESDDWSGGELKNEANSSSGNLGGVRDGAWVQYQGLYFEDELPRYLAVRYATSHSASEEPSTLGVHAGDADGELLATVDLVGTGGWGNYTETSAALSDPQAIVDAERVTFVFGAPSGRSWAANVDWFRLSAQDPSETSDGGSSVVVEAEDWTDSSGGDLKAESNTWSGQSLRNVGGTHDGDWLAYGDVDFGGTDLGEVAVHYVNNSSRCGQNSAIDVYLDEFDPADPGEPFATVDLAVTGSGWGDDGTATAMLPQTVTGTHEVFLRLRTEADASHPYVANIDNLTFSTGSPTEVTVEAEDWSDTSGGSLKNESSTWDDGAVTNVGGTHDGDWLTYAEVDFGSAALDELSVHYVHNSGRCGRDSAIDVYLDGFDPAEPGEPFATVELPSTGSSWSSAGTATVTLPEPVRGTHELTLVLRTDAYDSGHPYVANLDRLTFVDSDAQGQQEVPVDFGGLQEAVDTYGPLADQGEQYGQIDFAVFLRELDAARDMLDAGAATQEEVDAQARRLRLAAEQLDPSAGATA